MVGQSAHPVSFFKQGGSFFFPLFFGFGFFVSAAVSAQARAIVITPSMWLWLSPVPRAAVGRCVAWGSVRRMAAPLMHARFQDPRLCRDETDRRATGRRGACPAQRFCFFAALKAYGSKEPCPHVMRHP